MCVCRAPSGNLQWAGVTGHTHTRTASDLLRSRRPFRLRSGQTSTKYDRICRIEDVLLDVEISEHLDYGEHAPHGWNRGNSCNGERTKAVLADNCGQVEIDVPRDREGT